MKGGPVSSQPDLAAGCSLLSPGQMFSILLTWQGVSSLLAHCLMKPRRVHHPTAAKCTPSQRTAKRAKVRGEVGGPELHHFPEPLTGTRMRLVPANRPEFDRLLSRVRVAIGSSNMSVVCYTNRACQGAGSSVRPGRPYLPNMPSKCLLGLPLHELA
jgi:hypothetical protein